MNTSRGALVALAAAAAFTIATAGPSKAADPKEHYGMVVFLKGSEFFNWAYAGFQDEAATLGATTELQGPADWDASAEARAVDQLVAKGVKGVAVTAGDADTLVASIDAGMKAKVPVLTFNSDSPKSHRLLFVGTNNYNAGYQAGLAVAKLLGDKARVGISRIPGLNSINHRVAGFTDALKKAAPGRANCHRGQRRRGSAEGGAGQYGDASGASRDQCDLLWTRESRDWRACRNAECRTGRRRAEQSLCGRVGNRRAHSSGRREGRLRHDGRAESLHDGRAVVLQLWSAAHPTQFDSMTNPGLGQVPTSDLDTGVKILVKGDPAIKSLMTPPKL